MGGGGGGGEEGVYVHVTCEYNLYPYIPIWYSYLSMSLILELSRSFKEKPPSPSTLLAAGRQRGVAYGPCVEGEVYSIGASIAVCIYVCL